MVGLTGWQEVGVISDRMGGLRKVRPEDGPLSTSLGVLGLSGITAYFGMREIGRPQPGQTVLVSTAAGSVGSAAGQIASIGGARTVGIAGGPTKTALCREVFGFEQAIDYKRVPDLGAAVGAACPDGIDVYYDNVGGPMLDAILPHMNLHGRVVICGTASIASWDPPPSGLRLERLILIERLRVQGFIVFDYADRYAEALTQLRAWFREGRLAYREDIVDGLEQAPAALAGLYEGRNMGRQLVRVGPDPTRVAGRGRRARTLR